MAMTVANNNAAALALGELNKNANKLAKDLKKVSTGTKITGATDGASEYAQSEKLRILVRALGQDIENSQKGITLVKTAEGGIQGIIDSLRTMKELALNSLNDHNSEKDRKILQKEFSSRMAEIDELASTTNYNGKILLDGRYWYREGGTSNGKGVNELSRPMLLASSFNGALTQGNNIIPQNSTDVLFSASFASKKGGVFGFSTNAVGSSLRLLGATSDTPSLEPTAPAKENQIQGLFPPANAWAYSGRVRGYSPRSTSVQSWPYPLTQRTLSFVRSSLPNMGTVTYHSEPSLYLPVGSSGSYMSLTFNTNNPTLNSSTTYYVKNDLGVFVPCRIEQDENDKLVISQTGEPLSTTVTGYTVDIDFSNATVNGNPVNLPIDLNNQSISILCQGCYQFVSIKLETNRPAGTGVLFTPPADTPSNYKYSQVYVVGIGRDVQTQSEILQNIFRGIQDAKGENDPSATDVALVKDHHSVILHHDIETDTYSFWKADSPPPVFYNGGIGSLSGGDEEIYGVDDTAADGDDTISGGNDTIPGGNDALPGDDGDDSVSGGEDVIIYDDKLFEGNPLIIHTGPKANQHLRIYINDMRTKAMGLEDAAVDPQEKAREALEKLDLAVEYALNENVRMGAYQMRLEETIDNLVIAQENAIHSESVIRDADMSKAIMNYTKSNILAQAAQAMLAQANQNAGDVLGLL